MQRIPFLTREKACYLILRRKGLSINQIADFSGRSTSVVRRAIKLLEKRGVLRRLDMRKLPYYGRMLAASRRRTMLENLQDRWLAWLCGEEAEPP